MAWDQPEPMTDEEIEALREEIDGQREEIREYLADEGVNVSDWSDDATSSRDHDGEQTDEVRPDGGDP